MTKSKKIIFGFAIVLVVVAGMLWFTINSSSSDKIITLKVGVIIPETGPIAFMGVPMRNAIQLAHSDYEEQLKKEGLRIELTWGDSKGKPGDAVTVLNKMITIDGVNSIICNLSGAVKAVYPVAKANNLFFVGLTVDPSYFKAGDNAIRIYFSFLKEGKSLAKRVSELGWHNVLILNSTDAATMYEVHDVLIPELKNMGIGTVVDDFTVAQKDFKDLVAKHNQASVDGLIIHGFGTDIVRLAEAISNSPTLSKFPKLGSFGCVDIKPEKRALMSGIEFFAPIFAVQDKATGNFRQVAKIFSTKFPGVPFDHGAVYAYDSYAILAQALLRAKSTKPSALYQALSTPVNAMTEVYHFNQSGNFDPAILLARFAPDGRILAVAQQE